MITRIELHELAVFSKLSGKKLYLTVDVSKRKQLEEEILIFRTFTKHDTVLAIWERPCYPKEFQIRYVQLEFEQIEAAYLEK